MSRRERRIVDKNMLRSGKAAEWLAGAPNRQIMITEFLLTECMAGDSISNLCSDFKSLHVYADRILFLKTTAKMSLLRPRSKGLQRRWIDWRISTLMQRKLKLGPVRFREHMLSDPAFHEFANQSKSYLNGLLGDIDAFKKHLLDMIQGLPANWVKHLKKSGHVSNEFAIAIFNLIRDTAAEMFHGRHSSLLPTFYDAVYSFEYRYATACALLAVDWTKGGLETTKATNLRNDLLDMRYVAFGTMFDGLLTKENKVRTIYLGAQRMSEIAALVAKNEELMSLANNRRRNPYSASIN